MGDFRFNGLMAPVFTPFTDERQLNLSIVPGYAQFLKECGVDGVLVNSASGEEMSQTVGEREQVAEAWVAAAKKTRQTVIIQVGGTNMQDTRRLAAHAEQIEADGVLCLPELFYRPTSVDELMDYLKTVGRAAPNTPLFYYHVPLFTEVNVNVEELLTRGDALPTFTGLKFAGTNINSALACINVNSKKYTLFVGVDTVLAPLCAMGYNSTCGSTVNLFPAQNKAVITAAEAGNIKEMQRTQKTD